MYRVCGVYYGTRGIRYSITQETLPNNTPKIRAHTVCPKSVNNLKTSTSRHCRSKSRRVDYDHMIIITVHNLLQKIDNSQTQHNTFAMGAISDADRGYGIIATRYVSGLIFRCGDTHSHANAMRQPNSNSEHTVVLAVVW